MAKRMPQGEKLFRAAFTIGELEYLTGVLAAVSLALFCISSHAQSVYATNLVAYNFDTNQAFVWTAIGADAVSVQWDSSDASNNPASGSMLLTVNCNGGQYLVWDGMTPRYSPLPLQGFVMFTNISWDMRYDGRSAIRTNSAAAGVNGSRGPGSLDFGYMRVGTIDSGYGQNWYYAWSIPATNDLGQPNTNWIHVSVDLSPLNASPASDSSLIDTMFGQDDANFGNNVLKGNQYICFDNITFSGSVGFPALGMSIQEATPALRFFGGNGSFGRSQITLADNNESWIGGPFPISYSMTLMDNAGGFPTVVDTHIHIIQGDDNYSGADYTQANALWLQILSTQSNTVTAQIQWKTNHPDANPGQDAGTTMLQITNPVRAGTWTLTFLSDTNGTLTAPGGVNVAVPFTLGILSDADAIVDFGQPVQVRFGLQNDGSAANSGIPDDWRNITVSGTAGLGGTNYTENFSEEGTNLLNTAFWNLATSDGADDQVLVPTNAPYWVIWSTPDTGFFLQSATSLTGPWGYPFNCSDCLSPLTSLQAGRRWNLMLPQYLPTANGLPGGPLSPTAYFRLSTTPPPSQ